MEDMLPKPRRWAILIGVNFYGKAVEPLRGAVSDVDSIQHHLLGSGVPEENIKKFTASQPSNPGAEKPPEEAHMWPTRDNVTKSMQAVTQNAANGDFVYVHFSGHGTSPKASSSIANHVETGGELALVLFEPSLGVAYLHGCHLASLLRDMIRKSLVVTIVLDCCFSGSVVRRGHNELSTVRYIDFDPTLDQFKSSQGDDWLESNKSARSAHEVSRMLLDSDDYTILCACGPHESAEELCLESATAQSFRGALSHFLLQVLKSLRGAKITTRALYDHLRLKFRLYWPQQTPMWFGRRDLVFLYNDIGADGGRFITAMKKPDSDRIYIDAGLVHGLSQGDEYAVYHHTASEDSQPACYGYVNLLGKFSSELTIKGQCTNSGSILKGTRWKVKRLSLSSWRVPVRVPFDVQDTRASFDKARKLMRLIHSADEDNPCIFTVSVNESQSYQILDESRTPVPYIPTVPEHTPGAIDAILNTLEHLTRYKYVEYLENLSPLSSFERSFEIYLEDGDGNKTPAESLVQVKHGETVTLTVENSGNYALYISILDMGSMWDIDDVLSADCGGDFRVVPPMIPGDYSRPFDAGSRSILLEMTVPDAMKSQGQVECEETLKVFVTSVATSFSALTLPEICPPTNATDGKCRSRIIYDGVFELIDRLSLPVRGTEGGHLEGNWSTRSFVVRTRL